MAKKKMTLEEKLEEAIVKDVPYKVPNNWLWIKFGAVCKLSNGYAFKSTEYKKSGVPILRISNIQEFGINFDEKTVYSEYDKKLDRYYVNKGDLLIAMSGATTGKTGVYNESEKSYLNQRVGNIKIKYPQLIIDKFRNYIISYKSKEILDLAYGGAQPNISTSIIEGLNIPLPPLKEQQRIVDKIESLFEKLDKAKELIEEARDDFEKRKSAILEKAFRGELTKEWRKTNVILDNKVISKINEFYYNKLSKKDYKILTELQSKVDNDKDIEGSNWLKCNIGAVAKVTNGSTPSRQKKEFWNGNIPWVSSGEVRNNRINCTKECITEEGFNNSSVKLINKGSVLMAMIGEGKTRGQSSILDIDATTNQNIAAIDLSHKEVETEFLWHWLQYNYKKNRDSGNGTGPKALNCKKVRELDFVVPPKKEQKEIVKILNKILEKESKIEELTELEEQIELIKKSILAKAFRGELGTNCEDDENAMELLKEILNK